MRLVKQIPHQVLSISIFSANNKYLLKLEYQGLEQIYKFDMMDLVNGIADIEGKLSNEFLLSCFDRFKQMISDSQKYFF